MKFKYNQLLDMVHSDENTDREYIKKLLKHKNYCSEVGRESSEGKGRASKQRPRGITANGLEEQRASSTRQRGSN